MNVEKLFEKFEAELNTFEKELNELSEFVRILKDRKNKLYESFENVDDINEYIESLRLKRELVSFGEARKILAMDSNRLSRLTKEHKIKRRKIDENIYKYSRRDLQEYIDSLPLV